MPIEHCGDWTLYDRADHLGRGNLWAAIAVTEKRGDHKSPPAPRDPAELAAWFRGTSAVLLTALDADPSTEAWTFFPPHTVGFWQRRRCLETLVHRWDVEHALGVRGEIHIRAPEHAVRFAATHTGSSWVLGPGDPVAAISASATDLLLMLWGRLPRRHHTIKCEGDREAAQVVLAGPLVP